MDTDEVLVYINTDNADREDGCHIHGASPVLSALTEKYKNNQIPESLTELINENPGLRGRLKVLGNFSNELFGMSFGKYLKKLGLIEKDPADLQATYKSSATEQNVVIRNFIERYKDADAEKYGTANEAVKCLKGMRVILNKDRIHIDKAVRCKGSVSVPFGIDYISPYAFSNQEGITGVEINAKLTEIPAGCFMNCSGLTSVVIPEGITSIEERAFADCVSLKSIVLPSSLGLIAKSAFAGCNLLEDVHIKNDRILVSADAFEGCIFKYEPKAEVGVTDSRYFEYKIDYDGNAIIKRYTGSDDVVVIPGMIEGHLVTEISRGAFQRLDHIVEVSMSDYITTIQDRAFSHCKNLSKIHISDKVSKIYPSTFQGCRELQEANIPDNLTESGSYIFKDCNIRKLHIGRSPAFIRELFWKKETDRDYFYRSKPTRVIKSVTVDPDSAYFSTDGNALFSKDGKILYCFWGAKRSYKIPEGVERIYDHAFEDLQYLADVSFPDSLVSIGTKAFCGTKLKSVSFGPNLKEIEERAFTHTPITSVDLPASVENLGYASFSFLNPDEVVVEGAEVNIDPCNPYLKSDGHAIYQNDEDGKILLYFYDKVGTDEYTVEDGTVIIAHNAFDQSWDLVEVTLPDGLKIIEEMAFSSCNSLEEINLPDSLVSIGDYAFEDTVIDSLVIGSQLSKTGEEFLGESWNLDYMWNPRSIQVSENNKTFYTDGNILLRRNKNGSSSAVICFGNNEVIDIPYGVSEICSAAFAHSGAREIRIPSTVKKSGKSAFDFCERLTVLKLGIPDPDNKKDEDYAVVYIPEVSGEYQITFDRTRAYYTECFYMDETGEFFEFDTYDNLFEINEVKKDKLLIAITRLQSGIRLQKVYREQYITYLSKNSKDALELVIEHNYVAGLKTLLDFGIVKGKKTDQAIDIAKQSGKTEMLSVLMDYKDN